MYAKTLFVVILKVWKMEISPMGNKLYSQDVKVQKNLVSAKGLEKGVVLIHFRGKETTETKRAQILYDKRINAFTKISILYFCERIQKLG